MDAISYEPGLERIDVAIRAVVKLSMGGRNWLADSIGLTAEFREQVQTARRKLDDWRSEEGLFQIIRECRFVIVFALELLSMYSHHSSAYRRWHYERQRGRRVPRMA